MKDAKHLIVISLLCKIAFPKEIILSTFSSVKKTLNISVSMIRPKKAMRFVGIKTDFL
jgi:hypothetical protein